MFFFIYDYYLNFHIIIAQYDRIEGDTEISNEGISPVLSVAGTNPTKGQNQFGYIQTREYLPAKSV